jgi:hypothetical protein
VTQVVDLLLIKNNAQYRQKKKKNVVILNIFAFITPTKMLFQNTVKLVGTRDLNLNLHFFLRDKLGGLKQHKFGTQGIG